MSNVTVKMAGASCDRSRGKEIQREREIESLRECGTVRNRKCEINVVRKIFAAAEKTREFLFRTFEKSTRN